MDILTEALAAIRRGWALTPLSGKRPILKGWQRLPAATAEQVREWVTAGHNLGLRTGPISGVFVTDKDNGGEITQYTTPTVITGSGGRHQYFEAPTPCPGNSSAKLAPHVDTRGDGGQVVYVGSVHPGTGATYRWAEGLSPDEVPLMAVPETILALLCPNKPPPLKTHPITGTSKYGERALVNELQRLSDAPEGQRNDTLNRCAYSLAQLVGGDVLDHAEVSGRLMSAALAVGLSEAEASRTITSGMKSGIAQPRRPVIRAVTSRPHPAPEPESHPGLPEVLVPGAHVTEDGEYLEIGSDDFAREVLAALPPGALYRRSGLPGELLGDAGSIRFAPVSNPRMRLIVDAHVSTVRWKSGKNDGPAVRTYRPCDRDNAALVLAAAETDPTVRDLLMLVPYPVATGPDYAIVSPGWNDAHGIYCDYAPPAPNLNAADCHRALTDLLVDFPFAEFADLQNYVGLLLTPIIRPALSGNAPLHLIVSPLERTGKTKLAETVLGGIILGRPTAATQLSASEEERDKRILSLLLAGDTILHLDNLHDLLESGALASLITAQNYQGRVLGHTANVTLPNRLTIVGTGNNVRTSAEIAKRSVPIRLAPTTDAPEARTDYQHPDLTGYVTEHRRDVLAALLGALALWRDAGRPTAGPPLGGFEEWARAVGGILACIGMTDWRANERAWRRQSDSWGEDTRALVAAWWERHGSDWAGLDQLLTVADNAGAFQTLIRGDTAKGRQTSFGVRVMKRLCDVPCGAYVIRRERTPAGTSYKLDECS